MDSSTLFPFQPLNRFQEKPTIKKPQEITSFSYDEEHKYVADDSSINYYYPPSLPLNLCEGFESFRHFEQIEDGHLNDLLRAIREKEQREDTFCEADFVTWRGMLTKIMTAPYSHLDHFVMNATLHDGTIYIEESFETRVTERAGNLNASRNRAPPPGAHSYEMMMYWGYKLETVSLIPDIWDEVSREDIESRPQQTVSNYAQYCSVVQTGMGPFSVILGGEVDGVWDIKPKDTSQGINWIELKTAEEITNDHGDLKFERKLLKFWAQSFLLGVPKIIVGWRTKGGTLVRMQEFNTQEIPAMVRRGRATWDGSTCIRFASAFLAHLKKVMTQPGVYSIEKRAEGPGIIVQRMEAYGDWHRDILSQDFLAWRKEMKERQAREVAGMLGEA